MRKRLALAAGLAMVLPLLAHAGSDLRILKAQVAFTPATATNLISVALDDFTGYIKEIILDATGNNIATNTTTVYATGASATLANRTIVSATVTGDAIYRPRFNGHDAAGSALTSDAVVSEPFPVKGEKIYLSVTNASLPLSTNGTFFIIIKFSESE